jgi:hypothetical protein
MFHVHVPAPRVYHAPPATLSSDALRAVKSRMTALSRDQALVLLVDGSHRTAALPAVNHEGALDWLYDTIGGGCKAFESAFSKFVAEDGTTIEVRLSFDENGGYNRALGVNAGVARVFDMRLVGNVVVELLRNWEERENEAAAAMGVVSRAPRGTLKKHVASSCVPLVGVFRPCATPTRAPRRRRRAKRLH